MSLLPELIGIIIQMVDDSKTYLSCMVLNKSIYSFCKSIESFKKQQLSRIETNTCQMGNVNWIEQYSALPNGRKHGQSVSMYDNKTIYCTYVDGLREGVSVGIENGIKFYESFYKNGICYGIATKWDSEGKVVYKKQYYMGSLMCTTYHD